MIKSVLPYVLLGVMATNAQAQQAVTSVPSAEHLFTPVPEGFKLAASSQSGAFSQKEYTTQAEDANTWTVMVSVSTIAGQFGLSPDAYSQQLAQEMQSSCVRGGGKKLEKGMMGTAPYAQWKLSCYQTTTGGKPQFIYSRSLQAKTAFYTIQYAFRTQPTPAMEQQAIAYLKSLTLCTSDSQDAACKAAS